MNINLRLVWINKKPRNILANSLNFPAKFLIGIFIIRSFDKKHTVSDLRCC